MVRFPVCLRSLRAAPYLAIKLPQKRIAILHPSTLPRTRRGLAARSSRAPRRVWTARRNLMHRRQSRVDDQQQQGINRAAQEFTDALVAAYRATSGRAAAAQEVGARQIEHFFDAVIGNLRAQAGGTSQMARQLASQQRLAQEATRELAQA